MHRVPYFTLRIVANFDAIGSPQEPRCDLHPVQSIHLRPEAYKLEFG